MSRILGLVKLNVEILFLIDDLGDVGFNNFVLAI